MNIIIKTKRSFENIFMFLPTAVVDMKSEYKIYEISKKHRTRQRHIHVTHNEWIYVCILKCSKLFYFVILLGKCLATLLVLMFNFNGRICYFVCRSW